MESTENKFPEVNKAWQGPSSSQSAYKKLGSYCSVHTSEKLTRMKRQQLLLGPPGRWGHRESLRPRNRETDRWIQGVLAYLAGAEMRAEICMGTGARVGTPDLSLENFCTLSVDNSESEKLQEARIMELLPQFCDIYCQEHNQVSTIYIGEKSPSASGRGGKAVSVLKKARPQEKLVNQTRACWGITRVYLSGSQPS